MKVAGLGDVLIIKINHLKDELADNKLCPPEAERIDSAQVHTLSG